MKRPLVSIFTALVIIGSATALPTPDTARKNCESDGAHVWVEKTGRCIWWNPCRTDSIDYQLKYCLNYYEQNKYEIFYLKNDPILLREFAELYARNVLHTTTSNLKNFESKDTTPIPGDTKLWQAWTFDGDFFAFETTAPTPTTSAEVLSYTRRLSCFVHGYEINNTNTGFECKGVQSEDKCKEVTDFANRLYGASYGSYIYDKTKKTCTY